VCSVLRAKAERATNRRSNAPVSVRMRLPGPALGGLGDRGRGSSSTFSAITASANPRK
jgi:hypothetical protein